MFFVNGVKSEVLRAILDFMYMGEVHINNEDLIEFIEMAEQVSSGQCESQVQKHFHMIKSPLSPRTVQNSWRHQRAYGE